MWLVQAMVIDGYIATGDFSDGLNMLDPHTRNAAVIILNYLYGASMCTQDPGTILHHVALYGALGAPT